MAQTLTVKPEYVNKAQVFLDGKTTLLNNNLTQQQLLAIYLKPEFRAFIDITYTNVADSFPEDFEIDPNLFHAYDSGELTHNPAGVYPANTVGKHLNDTKAKIDGFDGQINIDNILPVHIFDFARARNLPSSCVFSRNSIASYVDKKGFVRYVKNNQPRFTHDAVTKQCLGYLSEEGRTNYILNSNNITGSTPTLLNKTEGELAPDGTSSAILISKKTNTNTNFNVQAGTLPNNFYTRSCFVKPVGNFGVIVFEGIGRSDGGGGSVSFDLIQRVFFGETSYLHDYGYEEYANGWLRPWVVIEKSSTRVVSSSFYIGGYGGSSTEMNEMYVWGFQFEEGKNISSYIPTSGTMQTRSSDVCYLKNSEYPYNSNTIVAIGVKRGKWEKTQGGYNRIFGHTASYLSYNIYNELESSDSVSTLKLPSANSGENFAYSSTKTSRKIVMDGGTVIIANSNNDPNTSTTKNDLYIGCRAGGLNNLNGTIKKIVIFASDLADKELKFLTMRDSLFNRNNGDALARMSSLNELAFWSKNMLFELLSKQEFSVDGTGASITRNIRRPYDFTFEVVDNAGVTSMTATPSASCLANTDNPLTFTAPVGKTLTYAITPVYEY